MFGDSDNPFGSSDSPEFSKNPSVPDSQKILQGLLAELPDEAQQLLDKINREVVRIQDRKDEEIADVRAQAEKRCSEIETKAEQRRSAIIQHSIEQLEPLQKELFRTGEIGKALGVFVLIQMLKARVVNAMPDPGNLLQYQDVGKTYCFQVTGANHGPVWGSDVYTSDSHLATAAVHAGALDVGEDGLVRVNMVDMSGMPIHGSTRNGVTSMDWGAYRVGYRITRV